MIASEQVPTREEPFLHGWQWVYKPLNWVAAELAAVWRLEFLPVTYREAFAFGLRAWLACMLALYLSFCSKSTSRYGLD